MGVNEGGYLDEDDTNIRTGQKREPTQTIVPTPTKEHKDTLRGIASLVADMEVRHVSHKNIRRVLTDLLADYEGEFEEEIG